MLVAGLRGWQWYIAHRAEEQIKATLAATVAMEIGAAVQENHKLAAALIGSQTPTEWQNHFAQEAKRLHHGQADGSGRADTVTVQRFDQQGEQVVTTILLATTDGKPAYLRRMLISQWPRWAGWRF